MKLDEVFNSEADPSLTRPLHEVLRREKLVLSERQRQREELLWLHGVREGSPPREWYRQPPPQCSAPTTYVTFISGRHCDGLRTRARDRRLRSSAPIAETIHEQVSKDRLEALAASNALLATLAAVALALATTRTL